MSLSTPSLERFRTARHSSDRVTLRRLRGQNGAEMNPRRLALRDRVASQTRSRRLLERGCVPIRECPPRLQLNIY